MHKLTGDRESHNPSLSPSSAFSPGKHGSTVSDGERNAARKLLLETLESRSKAVKNTDGRPRASSSGANAGVSKAGFVSTAPNLPFIPLLLLRSNFCEWPRRRSIVVEEDYEEVFPLPSTTAKLQLPNASTAPSAMIDFTTVVDVPALNHRESRNDILPNSSVSNPAFEENISQDDDEEEVVYSTHTSRARYALYIPVQGSAHDDNEDNNDGNKEEVVYNTDSSMDSYASREPSERELSWIVDSPVPAPQRSVHDDAEDSDHRDEDEAHNCPRPSNEEAYNDISSRYSPHLSVSPEIQGEPLSGLFGDLDGQPLVNNFLPSNHKGDLASTSAWEKYHTRGRRDSSSSKHSEDSALISAWGKVKSTFTRSNSATSRNSRSNSIVNRERRTRNDSGISRESDPSINNPRVDSRFASQQAPVPVLSRSSSAYSLALQSISRISPIPPATSDNFGRYQNAKLFPFPGIYKLEEARERNRVKSLNSAASTPDINAAFNISEDARSPSRNRYKHRTLVQQPSDPDMAGKYMISPTLFSDSPSSPTSPEYFDYIPTSPTLTNTTSNSMKLPMTLPAVKQWMRKHKRVFSSSSQGTPPISPSLPTSPNEDSWKKPSVPLSPLDRPTTPDSSSSLSDYPTSLSSLSSNYFAGATSRRSTGTVPKKVQRNLKSTHRSRNWKTPKQGSEREQSKTDSTSFSSAVDTGQVLTGMPQETSRVGA
ncbi:hypothetical protein BDP27DRAFT_1428233 [Rhodocollybia butyracea]|uniref:Uncharacterized protein n=1 Tax=Rhodocollybia butyracea TaxID=206335 RepID=A0A9P5U186_9AGAR|nr:hypothetical protein BDP27DRAFT_1428233 [Rhodocollybia butyracea]